MKKGGFQIDCVPTTRGSCLNDIWMFVGEMFGFAYFLTYCETDSFFGLKQSFETPFAKRNRPNETSLLPGEKVT